MAKIYYTRIKESQGDFTLDNVPKKWKKQTEELLRADEDYWNEYGYLYEN